MTTRVRDAAVCENEGCSRRAEPGEPFCAACCLETRLFHRELRWSGTDSAGAPLEDLAREPLRSSRPGGDRIPSR